MWVSRDFDNKGQIKGREQIRTINDIRKKSVSSQGKYHKFTKDRTNKQLNEQCVDLLVPQKL